LTRSLPDTSLLSKQQIPARERLIFALDVPSHAEAWALVERLGESVRFYKVGLELFLAGDHLGLVERLVARGKRVFVDLKLFDVPETVAAAVRQLRGCGATFTTVHGNDAILRAACAEKRELGILAVTALTSLDDADLRDLGFQCDAEQLVLSRARRALEIGCDGVVSSGLEAAALRRACGGGFVIVTPGIRPLGSRPADDQKRVVGPEAAFLAGADYIVVGRPIRDAADPRAQAEEIQAAIRRLFGG
jgi:orotidine-5'-phosphate decarboxylase